MELKDVYTIERRRVIGSWRIAVLFPVSQWESKTYLAGLVEDVGLVEVAGLVEIDQAGRRKAKVARIGMKIDLRLFIGRPSSSAPIQAGLEPKNRIYVSLQRHFEQSKRFLWLAKKSFQQN